MLSSAAIDYVFRANKVDIKLTAAGNVSAAISSRSSFLAALRLQVGQLHPDHLRIVSGGAGGQTFESSSVKIGRIGPK
jgi:hypothetical protein